jgi:hypothetical protein
MTALKKVVATLKRLLAVVFVAATLGLVTIYFVGTRTCYLADHEVLDAPSAIAIAFDAVKKSTWANRLKYSSLSDLKAANPDCCKASNIPSKPGPGWHVRLLPPAEPGFTDFLVTFNRCAQDIETYAHSNR